jgi:hypothetical protein
VLPCTQILACTYSNLRLFCSALRGCSAAQPRFVATSLSRNFTGDMGLLVPINRGRISTKVLFPLLDKLCTSHATAQSNERKSKADSHFCALGDALEDTKFPPHEPDAMSPVTDLQVSSNFAIAVISWLRRWHPHVAFLLCIARSTVIGRILIS